MGHIVQRDWAGRSIRQRIYQDEQMGTHHGAVLVIWIDRYKPDGVRDEKLRTADLGGQGDCEHPGVIIQIQGILAVVSGIPNEKGRQWRSLLLQVVYSCQ